ncbi:MAG: flagellar biosynthesis anti-sigma factor FlgM [Pseudomonadota bacterium]
MKVDNSNLHPLQSGTQALGENRNSAAGQAAAKLAASQREDQVQLSAAARALQAQTHAPVDQQRVSEIKAALASGQYQVDADAVAQKILAYTRIAQAD